MRSLILTLALGATSPALAIDHGLDFNLGGQHNGDATYDSLTGGSGMLTYGVSGTVALHKYVGVLGSYNHTRRGADSFEVETLRSAYMSDQWGLGAKVGVPVSKWFQPTVSAQFLLYRGVVKLDEDPNSRVNPGQIKANGLAPGGQFLGGVEFSVPRAEDFPVTAAFTIEAGYSFVGNHAYDDPKVVGLDESTVLEGMSLGDMGFGGFTVRVGAGLRF